MAGEIKANVVSTLLGADSRTVLGSAFEYRKGEPNVRRRYRQLAILPLSIKQAGLSPEPRGSINLGQPAVLRLLLLRKLVLIGLCRASLNHPSRDVS